MKPQQFEELSFNPQIPFFEEAPGVPDFWEKRHCHRKFAWNAGTKENFLSHPHPNSKTEHEEFSSLWILPPNRNESL